MNTYKLTDTQKALIAMRPTVALVEGANQGADLSQWCGSVFNQEEEGSCTACTTRDYLLWLQNKLGYDPITHPDVQALYYFGRLICGDLMQDDGSTVLDAFQASITYGIIPSTDESYTPQTLYTPPPVQDVAFHALAVRNLTPTTQSLRAVLDSGVPAGIAMGVCQSLFTPTTYNGMAVVDYGNVVPNEGHAILCVGYKPDPKFSYLYKIQNSWGTGYGDGGFVWLTESYLTQLLAEVCALTIPDPRHKAPPDYTMDLIHGPTQTVVGDSLTVKVQLRLYASAQAMQAVRVKTISGAGNVPGVQVLSDAEGIASVPITSDTAQTRVVRLEWTPEPTVTRYVNVTLVWLPKMGFQPAHYAVTLTDAVQEQNFVHIAEAHKWSISKL